MKENYQILIPKAVQKEIRKLDNRILERISRKINELSINPLVGDVKRLSNSSSYRARVGDYRIVYLINEIEKVVYITRVRHRREIY